MCSSKDAQTCRCDKPIHRDLETFISGHGRNLTGRLHTFLKAKPEIVPVKYESREALDKVFRLAKEFQHSQQAEGWTFNDIHLAMWIVMRYSPDLALSIPGNVHVKAEDHVKAVKKVKQSLLTVEPCLKHLLRGLAGLPVRGLPAPKILGDAERAVVKRDEGACILMGTADPEAVSILPFGVDMKHMKQSDQDAIDHLLLYGVSGRPSYLPRHKDIMSGLKSGDCPWNMISLSPQMRDWWNRLYFTLEFRGVVRAKDPEGPTPWQVQLRFRWLPVREEGVTAKSVRKTRGTLRQLKLTRVMNGHYHSLHRGPLISAVIPGSWQPLTTGQIFYVNVATEADGFMMGRLLEIRYHLSDVAHMSNAASVTSELVESYRDEDEEESETMSNFSYIDTPSGSESDDDLLAID